MWIKLLYFAQTLIWMRGILQLPMRREKKYYASGGDGSGGIFHLGIYRRLWRK